ncbi:hypothetical protein PHLGIDRAFT_130526 [Phlebiopsis gigantea 11061_1 CR5-6]|uniref:Extracellular membrane protein CFEM domain-containing protein n=1 Tax=Phlebiopsis gigantea (strain 11061_1 CR5-6) TaxID=745531 RepID=A0A0C3RRQ8_PHLG1|nr:hypothetical protein PHLGIDRAFT_130526 [Phlebiopsis gigantea 11061_1 CR5-6]
MVAGSLVLLSLVFAAGEAAASAVTSRNYALHGLLQARQGSLIDPSDIPSQCQSICTTMVTVFNSCSEDSSKCLEICQNSVMSSVSQCLSCSVRAQGGTEALVTQAQQALDELEDTCNQAGEPVNSFTVSGGSAAASTPASSASLSIPLASGTSQSIFFSSGSAAGASASSAVASASAPPASASASSASASSAAASTISKQIVTALSTPATSPASSSAASASALNPTATAAVASGAAKTAGVSLLGLVAAAVALAAQL